MADIPGSLRIATRRSQLALWQSRLVQQQLADLGVASELVTYETTGDRRLDVPLASIGSKGLFTQELEADLLAGRVDCCVHSLKDLPTVNPAGLCIAAHMEREDPRDVLVVAPGIGAASIGDLPPNAKLGTSSLRRQAQALALRPDLAITSLRGNVPTRIRKVQEGEVQAAVLAAAGLLRLGLGAHIATFLEPPVWIPAPGQGAIAIQAREGDHEVLRLLNRLDHAPTSRAVAGERAFLNAIEGGCQVPAGAWTSRSEGGGAAAGDERLHALVALPDGSRVIRGERALGPDPQADGVALAVELLDAGGREILRGVRGWGGAGLD